MASETVDPIDWTFPLTIHMAVPTELYLHSANAGNKSQDLLQPVGSEHTTFGMPGHHTAYAATYGIVCVAKTNKLKRI